MSNAKIVKAIIESTEGKAFSVVFEKANGEEREMLARVGVKKYLKGGEATYNGKNDDKGNIGVYEILKDASGKFKDGAYKCFNASRVKSIKFAGHTYEF